MIKCRARDPHSEGRRAEGNRSVASAALNSLSPPSSSQRSAVSNLPKGDRSYRRAYSRATAYLQRVCLYRIMWRFAENDNENRVNPGRTFRPNRAIGKRCSCVGCCTPGLQGSGPEVSARPHGAGAARKTWPSTSKPKKTLTRPRRRRQNILDQHLFSLGSPLNVFDHRQVPNQRQNSPQLQQYIYIV